MTKYKLYKFSGAMYIVPLDEYDYVDEIVESYFIDYCAGVVVPPSLRMNLIALQRNVSLIMVVNVLIFGAMIIMLL